MFSLPTSCVVFTNITRSKIIPEHVQYYDEGQNNQKENICFHYQYFIAKCPITKMTVDQKVLTTARVTHTR
jgi:hypothetical protein